MRWPRAAAAHVHSGTPRGRRRRGGPAGRLQSAGPPAGRRLLWGRLSLPSPLISRLDQLARRLAASPSPPDNRFEAEDTRSLTWAAVAVVLAPEPDALLLIRRAERLGDPWSGHMALPGGRREPGDRSLLDTAVRETAEEVGLALDRRCLLGALDDVKPGSPLLPPTAVLPFVFRVAGRPELVLNAEVAVARWVPLDDLLQPDTHRTISLEVRGEVRPFAAYQVGDAVVWGITERIVTALLARCLGPGIP